MTKHKPKNDSYRRSRGGTTRFFDLYCSKCGGHLLLYQKDGPGNLLRLYFDRIFEPSAFVSKLRVRTPKDAPSLRCPNCTNNIGTPMLYEREKRLSYLLRPGSFMKLRSDGTFPPPRPNAGHSEILQNT